MHASRFRIGIALAAAATSTTLFAAFEGGTPVATFNDASRTTLAARTLATGGGAFSANLYRFAFVNKLSAQDIKLAGDPADSTPTTAAVAFGDGGVMVVPDTAFIGPGSASPGTAIRIPVTNDADTLDVACDSRTAVVVGANGATPVALVDLVARQQLAGVAYAGKLARSVAVDDQGTQALVVVDDKPVSSAGSVRRLSIASGALTDTGEALAFGAEFVSRVYFAPNAKFGVVIVGSGATRLVSFSVPGLAQRSSVSLAGGTGNAVAFSPDGTRVYVRSGQRGIKDVIEAFSFDPATGAIGQARIYRNDTVGGFTGPVYSTSMAITPDGAYLAAADEDIGGSPPAPRLVAINAATGVQSNAVALASDARPTVAATKRSCKATPAVLTAIEYYHAAFDHYFATSIADEITKLDNGTFAGWVRTGKQFNVYSIGSAGAIPTCRFFSTSFGTRSSHFYATSASECATVKANPNWQFEGEVFATQPPAADGTCAPPTVPLYRMYNNGSGGAPNHRYTTQTDVRTQMIGQGWTPEGLGIGVVACVPP
jgi:hypothetical protein